MGMENRGNGQGNSEGIMNEKDGAVETYMHDGKLMIGRLQLMRNYKGCTCDIAFIV